MSASPFRSHLLQQWARNTQGRAPAAVVPWLKTTQSPESTEKHSRRELHAVMGHDVPSISTIDSTLHLVPSWVVDRSQRHHAISQTSSPSSRSTTNRRVRKSSTVSSSGSPSHEQEESSMVELDQAQLVAHVQSVLKGRRTATRLQPSTESESFDEELRFIRHAVKRAVQCAQMAPNHKRTEPFTFLRFLAGSQASKNLADIAYNVTLRKKGSVPNAESKRQKWLNIPGFLVTLVHNNQRPYDTAVEDHSKITNDEQYEALPYHPPETERQLEDYAASSAAIQNILLSLHAEGIGSKWATGPVIQTRAFRNLVNASPSDRVAALIMVGGTTEFRSEREEKVTEARRNRRRPIEGNLLTDLS